MADRIEIVLTGKDEASPVVKKTTKAVDEMDAKFKKFSDEMKTRTQSFIAVEKQKQDAIAASKREMERQEAQAKKLASTNKVSFTEVASAISLVQQGLAKVKQGYDFAREGAAIEFTEVKFGRLAATIGTTADALLTDLKSATRGTYSDMELMASATDFVGLGLAKTHDEAVRLASVSAGLNMDMNQLVLTLTNMTTMRFDALGVQVDGFDAKVEALKKTGMSADKAFKEAFLQQAEAQLEKVGNAADENIGTFMKLEATWKNFMDGVKRDAADVLVPLIDTMNRHKDAAEKVDEEYGKLIPRERNMMIALQMQADEWEANNKAMVSTYELTVEARDGFGELTSTVSETTDEVMNFKDQMGIMGELIKGELGGAQDEYNAKMAEYNKQLDAARTQKEKDKINENIAAETAEYEKRATAIMFNIQQEAILNSTMPDSQKVEMIGTLAQSYGMLDQATVDAMISTQNVVEQVEAGNMAFETGISYLRGMTNNMKKTGAVATEISEPIMHLGTLAENSTEKFGAFKDKQSEMAQGLQSEAAPAIATVKSQWQGLMGLPDEINKTVNIQVNGSVPSFVDTSVSRGEQRHGGSAEAMGGLIQGFPMGGIVTGRGTSTSDSVPAWLSRGEYVVRAAAVQRIGAHNLERMEAGGGATGSGMYVHIDNLNVTGDGSLREELMRAVPYQV